jgi:hypothetical protein
VREGMHNNAGPYPNEDSYIQDRIAKGRLPPAAFGPRQQKVSSS